MTPEEMLKLAENIYEGLSEEDIAEIERVMLDRSNFISKERTERLQKILDEITDENLHGEIDFGKPVGKEIL